MTLLTCCTDEYKPLDAITRPTKVVYAKNWGHKFISFRMETASCWERVRLWQEGIKYTAYDDWMFFTGTDAMITNQDIDLESIAPCAPNHGGIDFIFCCDGNGLQSDSWLMRNTRTAEWFLRNVMNLRGCVSNEQEAMAVVLADTYNYFDAMMGINGLKVGGLPCSESLTEKLYERYNRSPMLCKIVPQIILNAYPQDMWQRSLDLSYSWQPDCFICHCPGESLEWRLENMPRYLEMK